jgi:hypothetical protein
MSTVKLSTIRQRFATKITSLDGFEESRNPFDGYGRSPNTIAHKRFAVGIRSVSSRDDDRQRSAAGALTETEVFVRYAYRIKPKDQIDSYDNGLDSAQDVIEALTPRTSPLHNDLQIRWTGLDNELSDSGEWMTITITFIILHYINLTT